MKHIEIKTIQVHANIGTSAGDCIQECIELAAKQWQNVELTHNGDKYRIHVNELFASVKKG